MCVLSKDQEYCVCPGIMYHECFVVLVFRIMYIKYFLYLVHGMSYYAWFVVPEFRIRCPGFS